MGRDGIDRYPAPRSAEDREVYITEIRRERLHPQDHENKAFCRLLKTFYQSVLDASDALEVVSPGL